MDKYENLLKEWCDRLIDLQVKNCGEPFDGGFRCPACTAIHGRADNAVFPFTYMYAKTGKEKYKQAIERLLKWQKRLTNPDGSVYNDGNNSWKGITVFSAIGFFKTLKYFPGVLDIQTETEIDRRCAKMSRWIYAAIGSNFHSNINYKAAASAAMAFAGKRFGNAKYIERAKELAEECVSRITENGILFGEGVPYDEVTKRGCRPVDIGYNVEESIPCLVDTAEELDEKDIKRRLAISMSKMLDFMLPDGGWDNSFGTRNNKWTYYGSRTSDGCVGSYLALAEYDNRFYEAALRNADLQKRLTNNGLIYGGPDYVAAGEMPCTHHTFCHAAGLADALLHGLCESLSRTKLPCDSEKTKVKYYPETDTYRINTKNLIATVTGYDYRTYTFNNGATHASGGTLTMLYIKGARPAVAASTYEYKLTEPLNMQLSKERYPHRTLIPRAELVEGGKVYSNCFDSNSKILVHKQDDSVVVTVTSSLIDKSGKSPATEVTAKINYILGEYADVSVEFCEQTKDMKPVYVFPLIKNSAVLDTTVNCKKEEIFYLSGGFIADEYSFFPDSNGKVHFAIKPL